ncbi:MAG: Maf family protein, partial [Pseudomonadota bacterium]
MSDSEQSAGAIPRLILASGSSARHAILKNASIAFTVIPADIDEDAVRNSLLATDQQIDPADLAEMLAQAKGSVVSTNNIGSLVIAADQILVCVDEVFTKPADQNAARETLMKLRGKTHQLHSAVVLARDGEIIWSHVETAN